jgi:hypothetical protein
MNRADYAYAPLSLPQYEAIIAAGEIFTDAAGYRIVSPLHGETNWRAADAAKAGDVDLRVVLAGTLFEDHNGTDPDGGVALAKVYNFGGIKWAGQPGAYDSGIPVPPNELPGTYAGFHDFGGFVAELIRTLDSEYCGPAFQAGSLALAWGIYIGGSLSPNMAGGQARVDQWRYYRDTYRPEGASPVTEGIYGEDLIAMFETQIGHRTSGDCDPRNGIDHPWAYYCRAGVESTGRNCGLDVTARTSALAAQQAAAEQGLLVTDGTPPEHGAVGQFDTRFYAPDGHTGLWDAEKGMLLGTLTDGTGVGYKSWGPGTIGYAGWYRLPGVVGARRPVVVHPPMDAGNLVIPGNPYDTGADPNHRLGMGGAFRRVWELTTEPLELFGFPMTNEYDAVVTDADGTTRDRVVQEFERTVLIYQAELTAPWNVVAALRNQQITKKGA